MDKLEELNQKILGLQYNLVKLDYNKALTDEIAYLKKEYEILKMKIQENK